MLGATDIHIRQEMTMGTTINGLPTPEDMEEWTVAQSLAKLPKSYEDWCKLDAVFTDWFDRVWQHYPERTQRTGEPTKGPKMAAAVKAYRYIKPEERVALLRAVKRYAAKTDSPKDLENFIRDNSNAAGGVELWREYTKPSDFGPLAFYTGRTMMAYRRAQVSAVAPPSGVTSEE